MNPVLMALTALILAAPLSSQVQPGEFAPEFELRGIDGDTVALADLRGQIVVLEWTSHLCPAVAGVHESGILADTRAAIASEDVVWLQVDSSWFAPAVADDIRAWRRRLGLDEPYLLDTDGRVARAFGAQATPHVFVVGGDGVLAYSGLVHDDTPEEARTNYVVATVRALLEGEEIAATRTQAVGCTVKLGTPREAAAAEVDEDLASKRLYQRAVEAARKEDHEQACELLVQSIGAGLPRPWRIVADDAFASLLTQAEPRLAVRRLLDDPARGSLVMVPLSEPGEPLVIAGTVRDESGEPVPGAVVSLYQTDDAGYYSPGSTDGENARLFGRVATDGQGRYRVRTIVPGHYAGSGAGVPLHVHMGTRASGFHPAAGHRASLYFEGDPALTGANLEEIRSDGCAIRSVEENAEGVKLVVHDIVLRRE